MKISVSLVLLLCISVLLHGEVSTADRVFDQSALEAYHDSPEFDYSSNYAQSGSWWNILLIYLFDLIARFFEATGAGWLTPYFFRLLIIVVIIAVLYYIIRNRYGSMLEREGSTYGPSSLVLATDDTINYDQLIKESVSNAEFKMAIRYQFLKTLNDLSQKGLVKITQWKAPLDYMDELPAEKQSFFEELTKLFEVTWYGDYEADQESYEKCNESAKQLVA
ncbi:MAG: hypothetical protein RIC35_21905 [Marinoscillum sp.]